MILYQEVATDSLAETYGQLQSALIASQPHQRRWHTHWHPSDLHPLRALALLHDASSISCPLDSLMSDDSSPVAWTEASLTKTYRHVQQVQLVLEPVAFFVATSDHEGFTPSELSEAEFLSRLLTRTGCGWLANLTQLFANSVNQGFDPYEFLAEVLPVHRACNSKFQAQHRSHRRLGSISLRCVSKRVASWKPCLRRPTPILSARLLRIDDELQRLARSRRNY